MANAQEILFPLPLKGYNAGSNINTQPVNTTGDMNNVRPFDSLERKLRLGQRPGMAKVYDEQIASAASPIIAIGSISVVDYVGD